MDEEVARDLASDGRTVRAAMHRLLTLALAPDDDVAAAWAEALGIADDLDEFFEKCREDRGLLRVAEDARKIVDELGRRHRVVLRVGRRVRLRTEEADVERGRATTRERRERCVLRDNGLVRPRAQVVVRRPRGCCGRPRTVRRPLRRRAGAGDARAGCDPGCADDDPPLSSRGITRRRWSR